MNKFNEIGIRARRCLRSSVTPALLLAISVFTSGCYFVAAVHDYNRPGGTAPWWCKGTPDLNKSECTTFSAHMDIAVQYSGQYPSSADFIAAGATAITSPSGLGAAYINPAILSFDPAQPNVLLYDGNDQLAGVAWAFPDAGSGAPEGFAGSRDVWQTDGTHYWLPVWAIRGYENHPNVFAQAHPCLAPGVTLAHTTDACFVASHTEPFEVVVSNDDGYSAAGIDALVEGLYGLPNVSVHVVAPLANQSGSGDSQTRPGYVVSGSAATTISGRPATAVSSTDPNRFGGSGSPADSVLYALNVLKLSPEMVLTGMNHGQNMGSVVGASGTVGAARTARRNGVPGLASSVGGIAPPNDFPSGTTATLALLEQWRLGRTVNTTSSVLNINIPTCAAGFSIRGTVQTVVAPDLLGRSYTNQNCASTETVINDDVDAFNHGFIGITDAGAYKPPNWP